jgi:hypothetical protein
VVDRGWTADGGWRSHRLAHRREVRRIFGMSPRASLAAVFVAVFVLASACKQEGGKTPAPGPAPSAKGSAAAIAGTWHRVLLTLDENANNQLDDAERKPLGLAIGFTVLVIRADGTCDLENKNAKGKGTCTVAEEDDQTFLEVEPAPEHATDLDFWRHRVLLRSDRELVVKDPSGPKGAIYAFERR